MTQRYADFYPERVSVRVPSMGAEGQIIANPGTPYRVDFGAPPLGATIYTSSALTSGSTASLAPTGINPIGSTTAKWGRTLTIVASAACTRTFNVRGRNFLGERMSFSGTMNGTTPVNITKAFRYVDTIEMGSSADTVTISLATGAQCGLPYKATALVAGLENGVTATAGTLTVGVTAAQTGTNGDARGIYAGNAAFDSSKTFSALVLLDETNLHGNAAFYA
jgi:hypothetical protein